jgi:hypothetical protein
MTVAARRSNKLGLPVLLALTVAPALVVGVGLWLLADLVPQCSPDVRQSIASPDGATTLVTFGLDCGDGSSNTQAAIHPAGAAFSSETAQTFFSAEGEHDIAARWDGKGNIEITLPRDAEINRKVDTVAGISVVYR